MKKKELKIIEEWLNSVDTCENGSAKCFTQKEIEKLKAQFEMASIYSIKEQKEFVAVSLNTREIEYLIRILRRA